MNERTRVVLEGILEETKGHIGTHWEDCYRFHAPCLASLILRLEGEDTPDD